MYGEINLITAILDQWVKDAAEDNLSLELAWQNPKDYWFLEAISQVTKLEPEQIIDALIEKAARKATEFKTPRVAVKLTPFQETERRRKQSESLKAAFARKRMARAS